MVEHDLMSDIVRRHRIEIHTKGKIDNLAKISKADCTYFNNLMTKYSRYLHPPSPGTQVPLPNPDDLDTDFNYLKQWLEDFKKR